MTENIILFERNGLTGETVETVLTGADAEAWRAERRGADEELLADLRSTRDRLLAETDYLGLPDLGGFSAEMTAYRQALRDLPANTTDPANPVWPTKPGGES
jgi:hypothetical protein